MKIGFWKGKYNIFIDRCSNEFTSQAKLTSKMCNVVWEHVSLFFSILGNKNIDFSQRTSQLSHTGA